MGSIHKKYIGVGVATFLLASFSCGIAFAWTPPGVNPPNGNVLVSEITPWLKNGNALYYTSGNIGVGTTNPTYPLQVENNNPTLNPLVLSSYGSIQMANGVLGRVARGTSASPTATQANDRMNYLIGASYGGSTWVNNAAVNLYAAENQSENARGSYMTLDTAALGATSRSERMRIDPSGNVGIGITNPNSKLTVDGGAGVLSLKPGSADHVYIQLYADSQAPTTRSAWIGYGNVGETNLQITNEMSGNILLNTNNVGIGSTNPTQKLTVYATASHAILGQTTNGSYHGVVGIGSGSGNGSYGVFGQSGSYYGALGRADGYAFVGVGAVWATGAGSFNQSDSRLKEDVQPLKESLTNVLKLRPVTYRWKKDSVAYMTIGNAQQVGLLAQEVEQVYPQVVTVNKNSPTIPLKDGSEPLDAKLPGGTYGVAYDKLVPILIGAIQDQQKEIEKLQSDFETCNRPPD